MLNLGDWSKSFAVVFSSAFIGAIAFVVAFTQLPAGPTSILISLWIGMAVFVGVALVQIAIVQWVESKNRSDGLAASEATKDALSPHAAAGTKKGVSDSVGPTKPVSPVSLVTTGDERLTTSPQDKPEAAGTVQPNVGGSDSVGPTKPASAVTTVSETAIPSSQHLPAAAGTVQPKVGVSASLGPTKLVSPVTTGDERLTTSPQHKPAAADTVQPAVSGQNNNAFLAQQFLNQDVGEISTVQLESLGLWQGSS